MERWTFLIIADGTGSASQIRIVATGNDASAFKGQTVRLLIANAQALKHDISSMKWIFGGGAAMLFFGFSESIAAWFSGTPVGDQFAALLGTFSLPPSGYLALAVQAVAIRYRRPDGTRDEAAAFVGDLLLGPVGGIGDPREKARHLGPPSIAVTDTNSPQRMNGIATTQYARADSLAMAPYGQTHVAVSRGHAGFRIARPNDVIDRVLILQERRDAFQSIREFG